MMFSFLAIKTFLGGIPREVFYAIAAAIALLLIYNTGRNHGEAETQAAWDAATRAAIEQAREADDSAHEAIDNTRTEVEAGNAQARDAANGSNDPLRSGLDSMRRNATPRPNSTTCNSSRVRNGTACS